ncbi:MAG TPA: YciI family protein [Burkholderiales bacterium]|jgi:hypothetical protein
MKFMVIVKATNQSEGGSPGSKEAWDAMRAFNRELIKAGIVKEGGGLAASSKGKRVHFSGSNRSITDGPFAETKELIAGFWIWECDSMEQAMEWAKKCPNPMDGPSDIEIREFHRVPYLPEYKTEYIAT